MISPSRLATASMCLLFIGVASFILQNLYATIDGALRPSVVVAMTSLTIVTGLALYFMQSSLECRREAVECGIAYCLILCFASLEIESLLTNRQNLIAFLGLILVALWAARPASKALTAYARWGDSLRSRS